MSESETPRADHYRAEFKRRKEWSDLIGWICNELGGVERENTRLREERDKALVAVRDAQSYWLRDNKMLWREWEVKHAEIIALANKERK